MSANFKSYTVQIIYIALAWILYPLHFSLLPLIQKPKHSSSNQVLFCFNSCGLTLFRWGLDILINVLPSPIYVFIIAQILQSCKPVCNLNLTLFPNLWLKLNLCLWNLCEVCLPTANISLTFAITRWWPVSQSAPLKLRISSTFECHLLSFNTWSIWLWVLPSTNNNLFKRSMNSGNHCSFTDLMGEYLIQSDNWNVMAHTHKIYIPT